MNWTITVQNQTVWPLNIALKQVGVLHWKNGVAPGEFAQFQVGRVWFTVEAAIDDGPKGKSRYTEWDRTVPIVATVVGVVGGVAAIAAVAVPAILGTAGVATAGATGGAAVTAETAAAGTGAAVATGVSGGARAVATGVGGGARVFGKAVAGAVARKVVPVAAEAVATAAISGTMYQIDRALDTIKVRRHGVFAGDYPNMVVRKCEGDFDTMPSLELRYESECKVEKSEVPSSNALTKLDWAYVYPSMDESDTPVWELVGDDNDEWHSVQGQDETKEDSKSEGQGKLKNTQGGTGQRGEE